MNLHYEIEMTLGMAGLLRRKALVQRNSAADGRTEDAYRRAMRHLDEAAQALRQAMFAVQEAELAAEHHDRRRRAGPPFPGGRP